MSRIAELVSKGIRLSVGQRAEGGPTEIPADFFEAGELRSLARSGISADVEAFAGVYAEAQLPEPHLGYGIDRMAEVLESRRLAALPREVRVAAVLASLDAAGVALPQVVRDAVLRDRAIDAFVAAKERELEALQQRNEARIATLRQESERFVGERNREIEGLKQSGANAERAFAQLQHRKRQEQERLHEVLSHFVAEADNPLPAPGPRSATPDAV
jgi:hypothetical protein